MSVSKLLVIMLGCCEYSAPLSPDILCNQQETIFAFIHFIQLCVRSSEMDPGPDGLVLVLVGQDCLDIRYNYCQAPCPLPFPVISETRNGKDSSDSASGQESYKSKEHEADNVQHV